MPHIAKPFPDCETAMRPSWDCSGRYSAKAYRTEIRGWLRRKVPIYRVWLNTDFPMCLHASDGECYRPEMYFESDGGSIPNFVQNIRAPYINLQRDTFPRSYFLHDSGCMRRGAWVWNEGDWRFLSMTREKVDWLLREALIADGANTAERSLIYGAVRAYSRLCVRW